MIDFGYGVALGTIDQEDNDVLREWRNDNKIRRWCRQVSLITQRDQEKWFVWQNDDKSTQMFAILDPAAKEIIGVCGLTSIDLIPRRAEFSLYIAPNKQGLGFGQMALRTLCRYGFDDLNLNCIWGESFDGNPAITMFKRIGFKFEGTRREFYYKEGKLVDAHLYSILRREFVK